MATASVEQVAIDKDRLASADPSSAAPPLGPYFLFSVLLHALILVGLLYYLANLPTIGLPNPERTMEVSIVEHSDDPVTPVFETSDLPQEQAPEFSAAEADPVPPVVPTLAAQAAPLPPSDLPPLPEMAPAPEAALPELPLDPTILGLAAAASPDAAPAAGGAALPLPRPAGATSARARFFDADAIGDSFVFVIDRSASMAHLNALEMAKGELLRSLAGLSTEQRFQVIFYNEGVDRLAVGGGQLTPATDGNIRNAARLLREIKPDGGTNHNVALQAALALEPQVIYFLTDADNMQSDDVAKLTQANRRLSRLVSIHTIQFANGPPDAAAETFRTLALHNNGTHTHVNVQTRAAGR